MKRLILFLIITFIAAPLVAGNPPGEKGGLDKLKTLVGTWKGTDPSGKPVTVSYKLVSAGNSLMETLEMGEHEGSMVTIYHLDKDKVMMTHYCSLGNQPRMRLDKSSKDENKLIFKFADATNLKTKDEAHMHKLTFTFKDDDHFSQEWVLLAGGKENAEVFNFERVK